MNNRMTLEERVAVRIADVLVDARAIGKANPSRENSLVVTHLEDAAFRAERDMMGKGIEPVMVVGTNYQAVEQVTQH